MRVLVSRFVSVAVAVGLGVTSPLALAAPGPDADAPIEAEPVEGEPAVETDAPQDLEDLDADAPGDLEDLDTDAPGDLEDLDTDDGEPVPAPELDDETLDRDADASFDDDYQVLRDSPEARTARRWLAAGIAATATGAVLVGGAIAMSQTAPCDPNGGNNCFADARDRAAVTLGAPGGVLLLGGIAMTIVGALQRRALWHDLAFAPAPNGLVVTGRF